MNTRHTHFAPKRTQAGVADLANSPASDGDPRLGLNSFEHKLHALCIHQRFLKSIENPRSSADNTTPFTACG